MKNSNKNSNKYGGNAGKRQAQVDAGAFDGRFAPRVVSDKKKYHRKKERQMKIDW